MYCTSEYCDALALFSFVSSFLRSTILLLWQILALGSFRRKALLHIFVVCITGTSIVLMFSRVAVHRSSEQYSKYYVRQNRF